MNRGRLRRGHLVEFKVGFQLDPSMSSNELADLIQNLESDPERGEIAVEIQALQSIYSEEGAISIWKPEHSSSSSRLPKDTIRLDVRTALSPLHKDVDFRVLVSLPPTYPASSPPQLQILSRYIGAFQVDSVLFGAALKTYISRGRVEFTPREVAIFDGVENLREVIQRWYEERLSALDAAKSQKGDEKGHGDENPDGDLVLEDEHISSTGTSLTATQSELPDGVQIWVSEPIVDRKSTFIGRACQITHPSQVPLILSYLMEDKSTAKAAHPVINAWRCEVNGTMHQDNDDDGETAAGARLAHLLQILDLKDVLVVVTRYFGGIHLHGDRFRHINSVARAALEAGGFLDEPEDHRRKGRMGAKGRGKA